MRFTYLENLIDKRGVKRSVIARRLKISERALRYKIEGVSPFTWDQACIIQANFFPDIDKDVLFSRPDQAS